MIYCTFRFETVGVILFNFRNQIRNMKIRFIVIEYKCMQVRVNMFAAGSKNTEFSLA
jgi:hypothetical protein